MAEVTKATAKAVTKTTKATVEKTGTVIYIGPTIRNVAVSGTIYNNGVPKKLKDMSERHPVIKKLIVAVEKLPDAAQELGTKGTVLYTCYDKVLALLNEKEKED
ncbi:MAG: hypothetical protein MSS65_07250 [Clostridium sp.]|nr:hypothetical protein [Clostridium sp.]